MKLGKALWSPTKRFSSLVGLEGGAAGRRSGSVAAASVSQTHALVTEADQSRDQGRCAEAAKLYQAALRAHPARNDLRVQMANMLKDSGDYARAADAYRIALAFAKDTKTSADILLQMGRALAQAGRKLEARDAYWRCLVLAELGCTEVAAAELAGLSGGQG